jgi:hypothetical protein
MVSQSISQYRITSHSFIQLNRDSILNLQSGCVINEPLRYIAELFCRF